jgi:hypothetical protein
VSAVTVTFLLEGVSLSALFEETLCGTGQLNRLADGPPADYDILIHDAAAGPGMVSASVYSNGALSDVYTVHARAVSAGDIRDLAVAVRTAISEWERRGGRNRLPTGRGLVEELIQRCSRLILENDRLISWIEELNRQVPTLRTLNSELSDEIHDLHVFIGQLEAEIAWLHSELRLSRGLSPRARRHVRSTGRLTSVIDQTIATVIGGMLVLGVTTVTATPTGEVIHNIDEMQDFCVLVETQLPLED